MNFAVIRMDFLRNPGFPGLSGKSRKVLDLLDVPGNPGKPRISSIFLENPEDPGVPGFTGESFAYMKNKLLGVAGRLGLYVIAATNGGAPYLTLVPARENRTFRGTFFGPKLQDQLQDPCADGPE